jgi:ribose 5-phosphate isomerase A
MTIVERALELVADRSRIGLGSGRAAQAFVKALGERIRNGRLCVEGVPTSEETATLARQEGIPLLTLAEAGILDLGDEKLVPQLGTRGKLPVEVTPFALALCERRLSELGCRPVPYVQGGGLFVTDNGNHILDCQIGPIADAPRLEMDIRAIPGVVGTGLFLGMADTVLVGDQDNFRLIEERRRGHNQQR